MMMRKLAPDVWLFLLPVLMVVVEWIIIDYLRTRLWNRPVD